MLNEMTILCQTNHKIGKYMEIVHKKYNKEQLKAAFRNGVAASKKGLHVSQNPHGIGTMDLFAEWDRGYNCAKNNQEC
jgi:hypothetical protein